MQHLSIKDWSIDDRPREKLYAHGSRMLSDAELLAILINTGTKSESALDISKRILKTADNKLYKLGKLDINELMNIKGIGKAKAIKLQAAFELGRRRVLENPEDQQIIKSSRCVFETLSVDLSEIAHEEFWVLFLRRNNSVISKERISKGGITGTVIDAKIIAKKASAYLASGMILCHNHPSGNINPSEQDIQLTKRMKEVGELIDCQVLDHVIIGQQTYYSFADEGIL